MIAVWMGGIEYVFLHHINGNGSMNALMLQINDPGGISVHVVSLPLRAFVQENPDVVPERPVIIGGAPRVTECMEIEYLLRSFSLLTILKIHGHLRSLEQKQIRKIPRPSQILPLLLHLNGNVLDLVC